MEGAFQSKLNQKMGKNRALIKTKKAVTSVKAVFIGGGEYRSNFVAPINQVLQILKFEFLVFQTERFRIKKPRKRSRRFLYILNRTNFSA